MPPALAMAYGTPMAEGILKAYELIEKRMAGYKASDLKGYLPWILMITDGEATDESLVIIDALGKIRRHLPEQSAKRIAFFPVGVEGANMKRLKVICKETPGELR